MVFCYGISRLFKSFLHTKSIIEEITCRAYTNIDESHDPAPIVAMLCDYKR